MKHHVFAGTRDDPHAQARQARQAPILLHSMSVFREIFEIIFAKRDISTVVEIGVESGKVSGMYAELGASTVYCVDPSPTDELRANLAMHEALRLVEKPSPGVLADLPVANLYVIDGDHNYTVVYNEIRWIQRHAPESIIVLHDVLWPWSRRDLYYQPTPLSEEDRNPASDDGPTVWLDELSPAGFVGLGAFTAASRAGGERNGVLTAVEDAISHDQDGAWHFELIPAVFGMGVVVRQTSPDAAHLVESLRPYAESRLLATMENNRIALYTRILQMQHEAAGHADAADQLAEAISRQRHDIARLEADLEASAAELERVRDKNEELRRILDRRFRPQLAAAVRRLGKAVEPRIRNALRKWRRR